MNQDMVTVKNAALDMAEDRCRLVVRLVAPIVDDMPAKYPAFAVSSEGMAIRHCRVCTPPPEVFTCQLCDWETEDHWRLSVHMALQPKWCLDRAKKKEKAWARRV